MAKLYNLARMTTATTGTGTITLGTAVSGYLSFSGAGAADGDIVSYGISDGVNSEIGTGTYTASGATLTRTVTKSTNANALISLSGTAQVFVTVRAEDMNSLDGSFGFRNRVTNPSGQINSTGTGTAADGTYWFDQWVQLNQSNPVTPSQLADAENGTPFMMRTTQSNAVSQRFGILQPIVNSDIIDARGQKVSLSARVQMSASTTLRFAIVEWTGTANSPTLDIVNDWTSATFTTGNFFITTTTTVDAIGSIALTANTLTTVSLSGVVSGSMNNLHVFFWTDSVQAQTVTMDVGKVQIEIAANPTPLAVRSIVDDTFLCQRFAYSGVPSIIGIANSATSGARCGAYHPTPMLKSPVVTITSAVTFFDGSVTSTTTTLTTNSSTASVIEFDPSGLTGLTTGRPLKTIQGGGKINVIARM
jgi:hypothetical protein